MGILKFLDDYVEEECVSSYDTEVNEFVRLIEKDVNCYGFDPSKVYEEEHTKKAENRFFQFAMHWMNYFGTLPIRNAKLSWKTLSVSIEEGYYDRGIFHPGRNYYMRKACEEYAADPEFNRHLDPIRFDYTNRTEQNAWQRFIEESLECIDYRMHKTNQQTATKLMIYAIEQKTKIKKTVYLPMI